MTHLGGWVPWKRSNKKKCNKYRNKIQDNTKKLKNLHKKHGCKRNTIQNKPTEYNHIFYNSHYIWAEKKYRYSKRKCNRKKKQLKKRLNSHKNKMKKIKDCISLLSPSKIATNLSPEKKTTIRLNQPYSGKRMSAPIQQQRGVRFGPSTKDLQNAAAQNNPDLKKKLSENQNNEFNNIQRITNM